MLFVLELLGTFFAALRQLDEFERLSRPRIKDQPLLAERVSLKV